MSNADFSIVVPTHGKHTRLPMLLESICASNPSTLREVIVVENGPKHGAEQECERAQRQCQVPVRYAYLNTPNVGAARNHGAELATSSWLVLFDDDVRLAHDSLAAYTRAFEAVSSPAALGGTIIPDYDAPPPDWLKEFLPRSARGYRPYDQLTPLSKPTAVSLNMAAHRSFFVEHSIFFDHFGTVGNNAGMLGEETRFQEKLLAKGWPLYFVPDAIAYHHVPADRCSIDWLTQRYYRHGMTSGFTSKWNDRRRLGGTPLWLWRQLLLRTLAHLPGAIGLLTRREQLSRRLDVAYARGMLAGFKLQMDTQESATASPPNPPPGAGSSATTTSATSAPTSTLDIQRELRPSSPASSSSTPSSTPPATTRRSSTSYPMPTSPRMPAEPNQTIIRHNVFEKSAGATGQRARPNLLLGHWPLQGPGSDDVYLVEHNHCHQNPTERLFQAEGNVSARHNEFINHHGEAVSFQPHNDRPRAIDLSHNSAVSRGPALQITGGDPTYRQ